MLLEQLKETESWWAPEQVTCGFFCVGRVGRRPVGWAGAWIYRCFTTTERLKYFKKCLISTRLTLRFGIEMSRRLVKRGIPLIYNVFNHVLADS